MTLVIVVVGWIVGIVVADWNLGLGPIWPGFAIGGLILAILMRRDERARQAAFLLIGIGLGIWRYSTAQPAGPTPADLASYNDSGYAEMVGIVIDAPDVRDQDVRLRVEMQSIRQDRQDTRAVHGLALVNAERFGGYRYGDKLRIEGEPVTPPIFDTFSYRDYLARSGVYSLILYPNKVTVLDHNLGDPIRAALFDVKGRSHDLITRLLPSPQSALLTGILLGDDNDLPPEVSDAFNQTGTTHIIAISGSNITVVAGLLLAMFGRLTNRWLAAALMVGGIVVYTFFVGASPSVVRAAIMGILAITAQRFGRRSDGLTALAASVWVMTILNPATLFDVGLVLSAAATLGLILYTGPLTALADRVISKLFTKETARRVTGIVSDVVLITVAAQITTLPIIFLVFGRFSAISFLTNILVVPVQPPIMSLGILAVAAGTIWFPAGQLAAWLVGILLSYTLAIIRATAQLPGASVPISVEPGIIVAYYAGLLGMTAILSRPAEDRRVLFDRLKRAASVPALGLAGAAIAILLWAMALSHPDGKLHVWFLSVGQGNAVLIQTPHGAHLLIDGGENPSQLRTALGDRLPFFKRNIDLLFITEPAASTIAALPPLFDRYAVRYALTNGQAAKDDTYRALDDKLHQPGVEVITLTAGYRIQTDDGVTIEMLHQKSDHSLNDHDLRSVLDTSHRFPDL